MSKENPEDILLGICLFDHNAFVVSLDTGLKSEHFGESENRELFDLLLDFENRSEKVDWNVLALRKPSLKNKITALIDDPHLAQNPAAHAVAIQNAAHIRLVTNELVAAHKLAQRCNPYESLAAVEKSLKGISDLAYGGAGEKLGGTMSLDLAVKYLERLEERIFDHRNGTTKFYTTGISTLDNSLNGGWRSKGMYVVAAGSGVGKTSFALNSCLAAARSGKRCLYFTVEMDALELMDKMLSNEAEVDYRAIDRGDLTERDIDAIKAATNRLARYPIKIDDEFNGDFARFKLSVSKNMRIFKPEIIFLDYIGQLSLDGWRGEAKAQMLARISHETKQLAMKHDVAIVALAQINRDGDQALGGPEIHHLKDCASFAHDSSTTVLIYQDAKQNKTVLKLRKTRHSVECDLIVKRELQFSRYGV